MKLSNKVCSIGCIKCIELNVAQFLIYNMVVIKYLKPYNITYVQTSYSIYSNLIDNYLIKDHKYNSL